MLADSVSFALMSCLFRVRRYIWFEVSEAIHNGYRNTSDLIAFLYYFCFRNVLSAVMGPVALLH